MKKQLAAIMAATMMMGTLAACGGGASTATSAADSTTTSAASAESSGEKTKITFWYSHSGDEAAAFEAAIASYNASQDKVEVEGLSVTDKQKIIVALSGSEAPDVIEVSNQDIINYANNGLIETLNDKADADGYDVAGTYSAQALTANTLNDDLYGMPLAAMIIEMFYNKDILAEIGYDAPPTTMEELYEMAVKATELDADGNITRLGYPLFPLASARQEGIYAFGGRWWAEDGTTLTPDDPGILDSLHMNVEYRSLYGIDKVNEFVATANTNRYTENDMFFAGKQLFRFDGTWLDAMIKANNADLNYGVALIPGTEAHPEDQGASRYETNSLAIPVTCQNEDAAWDFIKYFTNSDATKQLLISMANLPVLPTLYDDPDMLAAMPSAEIFIDALKKENGIQYATIADLAQYTSLINEELDYVYNGSKTPEEAMAELKTRSETLN